MLSEHIIELVGANAQDVIVLADEAVDVNTSSARATEIQTATFPLYMSCNNDSYNDMKRTIAPTRGVHIQVTESSKEPLHIICEHSQREPQYLFIEVAPHVEITIIEQHVACCCGVADTVTHPFVVELAVGANSHVQYSAFDTSGLELYVQRVSQVKRDGQLEYAVGMFGQTSQSETYITLLESGAKAESKLMMFAEGTATQLHKVKMNHVAPHTTSMIINHGVVADRAVGEFEGIGFIERGAHQADAQQESRIMVLDDTARADVHPILLIDEYDVMAGHAGSVGRVDEASLYYLQSRGLPRKEAMLLVTEGFLRPVVENITDLQTKERIEKIIEQKVGVIRE